MNDMVTKSTSVTRRAVVGSASALAVTGLGHRFDLSGVRAQNATPTSDPIGIDSVLIGSGVLTSAPGTELVLLRTTMAPGGFLPPHVHRGPFVISVESGTWGYTPQKGTVTRCRERPLRQFTRTVKATVDEKLDSHGRLPIHWDASQDWMRNTGDDEVVLFIAGLNPLGKDFGTLSSELDSATPAP